MITNTFNLVITYKYNYIKTLCGKNDTNTVKRLKHAERNTYYKQNINIFNLQETI